MKTTFGSCTSHPSCGRMGRPAQIGMLLHSLWYTDLTECFVWCEECLYESLSHFLTPSHMADKWEMVIQKCLLIMVEIIKKETVSIGIVHFLITVYYFALKLNVCCAFLFVLIPQYLKWLLKIKSPNYPKHRAEKLPVIRNAVCNCKIV